MDTCAIGLNKFIEIANDGYTRKFVRRETNGNPVTEGQFRELQIE